MSHDSVDRRTALKTFGGVVAGAGGFSHLGVVRGSDFVEVPIVMRHGEVIETKKVPRSWYEHIKRAHRVLDNRRRVLGRKEGVVTLGLSISGEDFGGKKGSRIAVGIDPEVGVEGKLPEEAEGIGVTINEVEEIKPHSGPCYGPGDTDPMPGGVLNEYLGVKGTSCVKVVDSNDTSKKYMLSAAHNFRIDLGDCSEDITGNRIGQETTGRFIGDVVDYSNKKDYAVYDNSATSNITFESEIHSVGIVNGQYTDWGVEDLKEDGDPVNKRGITTGKTEAVVKETGESLANPCWGLGGKGVKLSHTLNSDPGGSGPGDSGSPWYTSQSGSAIILGMHSAGGDEITETSCEGDELSETAYALPMHAVNGYDVAVHGYY